MGYATSNKGYTVNGVPYHINTNKQEELINYYITGLRALSKYSLTLFKNDPLNDIQDELFICNL